MPARTSRNGGASGYRVFIAAVTLANPELSAPEMLLPPAPLYTAITMMTIKVATTIYSNDTTPSWSARRRFKASVVLIK